MTALSELQRDALGEIFNIGVGRAASSLSQIVNDEVLLSAPSIIVVRREQVAEILLGCEIENFSSVSQIFSGPFDAEALLIFPETNALEIVRLMVGSHMTIDELSEFQQEAMCEVGNIILNACMSALADLLKLSFSSTLPQHRFGDKESIEIGNGDENNMVVLLQVDMTISQECLHGHIVFLLSVSSMANLLCSLNQYLSNQGLA